MSDKRVSEFLRPAEPCSIRADEETNYERVLEILERTQSGIVFITSSPGNLLKGIITIGDIRKVLTQHGNDLSNVDLSINMEPVCVSLEDSAAVALRAMRQNDVVILPVTSEHGQLSGYVTLQDIAAAFSPERLYLSGIEESTDLNNLKHLSRYRFASMFIESGLVLDCACGSGYGSKLLSNKSGQVYGIDISTEAIAYAEKNNSASNITYECKSLQDLNFPEKTLQTIVSLETLEHVRFEDMVKYLTRASQWLSPGGCFVGSSPMLRYQEDGKPYITNPYHVNELPRDELFSVIFDCLKGFKTCFFHQNIQSFCPIDYENTGFCVFVARKPGGKNA